MLNKLKWCILLLGGLAFLIVGFCIAKAAEPYRQIKAELSSAPSLDSYPPLVVKAVLLAEDPLFLESSRTETLRRIFQVFSYRSGQKLQGSTITGQLVRGVNTFQQYRRLNEITVSVVVDILWTKSQILSAYLGKVYLGSSVDVPIRGFRMASYLYYGKPLESLGVAEIAMLAALIKGPSFYSPIISPERALKRRATVLQSLKESGAITQSQFIEAIKSPLPYVDLRIQ
jgi:penicillin-binding protein 1B